MREALPLPRWAAWGFPPALLVLLAWWGSPAFGGAPPLPLPAPRLPLPGLALAGAGCLLAWWGALDPAPARWWTRAPVTLGAILIALGMGVALGSPAVLWLAAPAAGAAGALGALARKDDPATWLRLPLPSEETPSRRERVATLLLVFLPWLALYEAIMALGLPPDAVDSSLPFEKRWPVWELSEALYIGTYPFVVAVPLALRTRAQLALFARQAWGTMLVNMPLFLLVPFIAPPRPFVPQSPLGELLLWERKYDAATNAFPSYHVTWALLSAAAYSRAFPRFKALWWALGGAIAASTLTTGMHTLADVALGCLVVTLILHWEKVRAAGEGARAALARRWEGSAGFRRLWSAAVVLAALAAAAAVPDRWGLAAPGQALGVAAVTVAWALFLLHLPRSRGEIPGTRLLAELLLALFLTRLWTLSPGSSLLLGALAAGAALVTVPWLPGWKRLRPEGA